jgi:hypothetical protein
VVEVVLLQEQKNLIVKIQELVVVVLQIETID